jgi:cell division protein ZapA (FtsZ GTPase activity inhibitor)
MDIIVIDDNTSIAKIINFHDPTNSNTAIDSLRTANMADINVTNDINKLRELFSDLADFIRSFLFSNYCSDILSEIMQRSSILK